jgi:hypothetical protein
MSYRSASHAKFFSEFFQLSALELLELERTSVSA